MNFEYSDVKAPFGMVRLVEGARGVVSIDLDAPSLAETAERLAHRMGEAVELSRSKRSAAADELREYFAGKRKSFDVPVDWSSLGGFQRDVLKLLSGVPYGSLTSYGELARRLRKPAAARAVGGAMAKNPIPILLPCHRVVAADGSLGGFSGGIGVKRWLHAHEGIGMLGGGWPTAAERRSGRVAANQPARQRRSPAP